MKAENAELHITLCEEEKITFPSELYNYIFSFHIEQILSSFLYCKCLNGEFLIKSSYINLYRNCVDMHTKLSKTDYYIDTGIKFLIDTLH